MGSLVLFLFLLALYFLPTLMACGRGHRNGAPIIIVNLFFGWTILGWVIALAWSLSDNVESADNESSRRANRNSFREDLAEGAAMQCRNCHAIVKEQSSFCPHCGNPVATRKESNQDGVKIPLPLALTILGSPFVVLALLGAFSDSKTRVSSSSSSSESGTSGTFSGANSRIDSYVDEQVERHWRPMPGGNSKEDAKRVTKDILKAKTWSELEETMERHIREGR